MGQRLSIATGAIVVAITVGWLILGRNQPPKSHPSVTFKPEAGTSSAAVTLSEPPDPSPAPATDSAGSPLATRLLDPGLTAADDVENLRQLAGQYFTALQQIPGPPIGDNIDLTKALTGSNPLKLAPLPPGHRAIDATGRIVDRWGTPYHVHARSARVLTIRSAGPDRRLFTDDDLVAGE